jgi:hypothetical protein
LKSKAQAHLNDDKEKEVKNHNKDEGSDIYVINPIIRNNTFIQINLFNSFIFTKREWLVNFDFKNEINDDDASKYKAVKEINLDKGVITDNWVNHINVTALILVVILDLLFLIINFYELGLPRKYIL